MHTRKLRTATSGEAMSALVFRRRDRSHDTRPTYDNPRLRLSPIDDGVSRRFGPYSIPRWHSVSASASPKRRVRCTSVLHGHSSGHHSSSESFRIASVACASRSTPRE